MLARRPGAVKTTCEDSEDEPVANVRLLKFSVFTELPVGCGTQIDRREERASSAPEPNCLMDRNWHWISFRSHSGQADAFDALPVPDRHLGLYLAWPGTRYHCMPNQVPVSVARFKLATHV